MGVAGGILQKISDGSVRIHILSGEEGKRFAHVKLHPHGLTIQSIRRPRG